MRSFVPFPFHEIPAVKEYKCQLNLLCEFVEQRKFRRAEKELLQLILRVIAKEIKKPHDSSVHGISICEILCVEFNDYYLAWLEQQGGDKEKDERELNSPAHSNFLIAHCSRAERIEDALWKVIGYLKQLHYLRDEATVKRQLQYYLITIKNYLRMTA